MIRLFAAALAAVSLTLPAFAQDSDAASEPRVYESRGQVTVNGERIRYHAIAGETYLR
ncbi:MAG: peptidase S10, partial [Maricaulis sp.]|nr:peptidase S10 [Maricaulis sp.]